MTKPLLLGAAVCQVAPLLPGSFLRTCSSRLGTGPPAMGAAEAGSDSRRSLEPAAQRRAGPLAEWTRRPVHGPDSEGDQPQGGYSAAPAPSWVLSAGSPGGQGEGARPPQGGTHGRGRQVTCGQDTLTGLALGTGTRVLNAAISIPNSNPTPRPPFKGKPTNTTVGFEPLIEIKKMNSKRTEGCKRSAKGDPAAAPERRVRVPLDTPTNSGHFGSCICCEVLAKSPQIHIFWLCYF